MIKIYKETSVDDFEGWSGAEETLDKIREADKIDELDAFLEDQYPDGIDETDLNDLLRFEADWLFEMLGIEPEDEEDYE